MSLQPSSSYLVNFSQNFTQLAVASDTCYSIYCIENVDSDLRKVYTRKTDKIRIIELFFASSLVALVTHNAPQILKLWNYRKNMEIYHYYFSSRITAVRMNRTRIVIVVAQSITIFNIQLMKIKHIISDVGNNINGICALASESEEHGLLAYPGSSTQGIVKIFDTFACKAKVTFSAFAAPIAALAFNPSGTAVAVACELGTVINVFSSLDGTSQFKFLRGYKRYVTINSLMFSACGDYIISCSNTETVHIFYLKTAVPESSGTVEYLARTVAGIFPSDVYNVLLQRSYATAKLAEMSCKRIGAISIVQKQLRLLIAAEDGFLYSYSVPSVQDGECLLIRKHNLHLAEMDIMVESLHTNDDNDYDILTISADGAAGSGGDAAGGDAAGGVDADGAAGDSPVYDMSGSVYY